MSCNTHETTYFRAVNRVLKPAQPVTFDDHWYDLGTDPLIVLQLVGQLEDVFGVRVDKSELARIRTVRQLYDLFMQHMAEGITLRNLPSRESSPNSARARASSIERSTSVSAVLAENVIRAG
jgi:acyl carrier protein